MRVARRGVAAVLVSAAAALLAGSCFQRAASPGLVRLTLLPPLPASPPSASPAPRDPRRLLAEGLPLPPLDLVIPPEQWAREKHPPFSPGPFPRVWRAALPLPAAETPAAAPGPFTVLRGGKPLPSRAEALQGDAPLAWVADRETLWILSRGGEPPGKVTAAYAVDPAAIGNPLAARRTGDPATEPSRWRIASGSVDGVALEVPGKVAWSVPLARETTLRLGLWAEARGPVLEGGAMRIVEDAGDGAELTVVLDGQVVHTHRFPPGWFDEEVHPVRLTLPPASRAAAHLEIRLARGGGGGGGGAPMHVLLVDPRLESAPFPAPPQRRGVILIVLDTLRQDRLGCYGCPRATSPVIDAWSRGGTRFTRAMANANWTLPSHTSLFLSRFPHQHRVWSYGDALRRPAETLARRLSEEGVVTAAFTDGGWLRAVCGLDQGFGEYHDERLGAAGIFSAAAEWIRECGPARFFLFVHTYEVHGPYAAPLETLRSIDPGYEGPTDAREIYDTILSQREGVSGAGSEARAGGRGAMEEPAAGQGGTAASGEEELRHFTPMEITRIARRGAPGGRVFGPEQVGWLQTLYEGGVRVADEAFGTLAAALREESLEDEVLVILTSDHGESLGEHRIWGHKRSYYQEELAVPLLLRGPGVPRGAVREDVASLVDLAPSILSWWGIPPPERWVGRALLEGPRDRPAIASGEGRRAGRVEYAVREGDWKLLRTRFDVKRARERIATLHDLSRDPQELQDLSQGQMEEILRLKAAFDATREGREAADRSARETLDPAVREELHALGYAGG